ncbi:hypothetical protein [Acidipila sp. EB88]|uniref:hypothetical protein n=1 Tax=Acidipila sp. EB88 TaxID=2305226 RepID=UPI0018F30381|nr:hypothetical protein [Acidipila sp. EB88]
MAPHIIPFPAPRADRAAEDLPARARHTEHLALNAEDGTLPLLRSGFSVAGASAVALCLALFVFGGVGPQGARTSLGWLSLMVALMCMPFGLLMLFLGGAKWLRNQRLSRLGPRLCRRGER